MLIYDIGMNDGADTEHYLKRADRVVAVEANPFLAEAAARRFAREIADGRLIILNVGIAKDRGSATFWMNEKNSEWSSFIRDVGCRNGTAATPVVVQTIPLRDVIEAHGKPDFMKIDIEGHDLYCLEDISPDAAPTYISVEAHRLEYLALLHGAGYRSFKVVNQRLLPAGFPLGSSGPFAEETPGEWESLETVAYDWLHMRLGQPSRSSLRDGWYDFHARKIPPAEASGRAKRPLRFRSLHRAAYAVRRLIVAARDLHPLRAVNTHQRDGVVIAKGEGDVPSKRQVCIINDRRLPAVKPANDQQLTGVTTG